MIRSVLFPVLVIFIFSCGSDTKPVQQSAAPAINFKTLSSPVPFSGSWISSSYLDNIREHQSPRIAQEGSDDCFIQLPGSTLLPATMVINFHEGMPDLVTVSNNGTYALWEKQNDTLSRALYTIDVVSADTIKLGGKLFIKINPVSSSEQPRILEEILFKGIYQAKKGGRVEFKATGEVSGLGKYKYYSPVIDYYDAGLQVDQIGLGETPDNLEFFGFKFKKEKLELYTLKCTAYDAAEERCVEVTFGEKTAELRKTD